MRPVASVPVRRWLRPRHGFTVLEALIGTVILGVFAGVVAIVHVGGARQFERLSGHAAAVQNAQVLLSTIRQDLRQLAVLPGRGFPVFPYSVALSSHGKSFTLRRSADTTDLGSGFTIVTYQLEPVAGRSGVYRYLRTVRTPRGDALPDEQTEPESEDALSGLWLTDVRMDFVARFEADGRVRHFLSLIHI